MHSENTPRYVATFHNDFGAISFERRLKRLGDGQARLMPVPRQLSSSCGLGVEFFVLFETEKMVDENTDSLYLEEGEHFRLIFENK